MQVYPHYPATTPLKPQVIRPMIQIYQSHFRNPSSIHSIRTHPRKYLHHSPPTLPQFFPPNPNQLIFTTPPTESNNTAIKALVKTNQQLPNHIITTK
ncbi:aminotransferase class V-fold PLP-dependent enzyme, partial [Staphylococcus epidermidis]|uniref:aminotransferase class V-fold PLP-dependent enzyme n=1 Tax=Staphylococcus epidermidis TaxID=1282 RepID=UPI00119D5593